MPPVAQLRYNQVRQKSTHNSFKSAQTVFDQVTEWRVHSLEVDLHREKKDEPELGSDWWVYHQNGDRYDTTVETLGAFLDICSRIHEEDPEHDVISVFLDMKDEFDEDANDPQSGAALDSLLRAKLSGSVFGPPELLALAKPNAKTLHGAVANGWPTLDSLRGKFVFVLTGLVNDPKSYPGEGVGGRHPNACTAFQSSQMYMNDIDLQKEGHLIFFNMRYTSVLKARWAYDAGFVSRVYDMNNSEVWAKAASNGVHHMATNDVTCQTYPWSNTGQPESPFEAI